MAEEIGQVLSMTRRAAENRVAQAVEITTRTPAVLHALQTGALDLYRAKIVTDATYRLDDVTATEVAAQVVDRAEGWNASQVRTLVRRTVSRVDPEGAQRRQEQGRR